MFFKSEKKRWNSCDYLPPIQEVCVCVGGGGGGPTSQIKSQDTMKLFLKISCLKVIWNGLIFELEKNKNDTVWRNFWCSWVYSK
jgi:hypothetical protein